MHLLKYDTRALLQWCSAAPWLLGSVLLLSILVPGDHRCGHSLARRTARCYMICLERSTMQDKRRGARLYSSFLALRAPVLWSTVQVIRGVMAYSQHLLHVPALDSLTYTLRNM